MNPNSANPTRPAQDNVQTDTPAPGSSRSSLQQNFIWLWVFAGILWLTAITAGSAAMLHYAESPGSSATLAPPQWPKESAIRQESNRPHLVLFVHPRCPCSRATIGELEVLMARCRGQMTTDVLFLRPSGKPESWVKTDLWRSAEAIPGVQVHMDEAGAEARRFHAETSGQTLLYDSHGSLAFQGGITLARGHAGDNPGRSAVTSILAQQVLRTPVKTLVFGCALSEKECQQGGSACAY